MIDFIKFGQKVRELRRKAGLTQAELADKIAVGQAYIGYVENGIKKPSLETADRMVKVFGCKIDDLLN